MNPFQALILFALSLAHQDIPMDKPTTSILQNNFQGAILRNTPAKILSGSLTALLADNSPFGKVHKQGYNGLVKLTTGNNPSPFVESYAGLNLEHVNTGRRHDNRDLQFEPRRHPMELRRIGPKTFDLYQTALPVTGLESCTRFDFHEKGAIDVTFECIPRKDFFPFGYLNIFWASYIQSPEDPAIYFPGRIKGNPKEFWIKALSPRHGEQSTHRATADNREFKRDEPFPLTLVFNESNYEYSKSFYYGRHSDHVFIMIFDPKDLVRFTQSPSGGGNGNPAWDFQWFISNPKKDNLYRLSFRTIWKPWVSQEDTLKEYEEFNRRKTNR